MKKLFAIIITLLMTFVISSCGNEPQHSDNHTVTLKTTEGRRDITIKFEHDGDDITKLYQKEIISFESLGVDNASDAQTLLDSKAAAIPTVDGYENKIKVTEKHVVETIEINFKNIKPDKVDEIPGLNFIGGPGKNISLEKSIKELKKSGFAEVEEKK